MSLEANKTLARRDFEELWMKGNLDVADEIYSPGAVGHCRDLPDQRGYPACERDEVELSNGAFPDTLVTIDFQVAEDDMVVTRRHFEGTHTGPGYGDPTGRHVSVDGVHIHRDPGRQDRRDLGAWRQRHVHATPRLDPRRVRGTT